MPTHVCPPGRAANPDEHRPRAYGARARRNRIPPPPGSESPFRTSPWITECSINELPITMHDLENYSTSPSTTVPELVH